jgi:pimeloyl-ACP methyl ester carboxylesterase
MLASVAAHWSGPYVVPDFRGHGRSPHADSYTLADHASDLAELLASEGLGADVVVLGHSMGGAVGLELASGRYGFTPARVLGLGVKVAWSEDELAWLGKLARTPARYFATRDEALQRFLKTAGLDGLADPLSDLAVEGVRQEPGRSDWRLAADPATASVGAPPMARLIADARCPIRLAAGERDPMSKLGDLRRWDPQAETLPGLGHNAMVQDPAAAWAWLLRTCGL